MHFLVRLCCLVRCSTRADEVLNVLRLLSAFDTYGFLPVSIMCGIFCCYNRKGDLASFRPRAIALSKKLRHRGPDWSGCYMAKDSVFVHERLAIVGVGAYGSEWGQAF